MYTRQNPFNASIKERYFLSKEGSHKETLHLTLDLKGSGITYEVGDSVGILPQNDPVIVEKTVRVIGAKGNELITNKRSGASLPLIDFLTHHANIRDVSRKLIKACSTLEPLLTDKEQLKAFQAKHEVWDFLESHPEVRLTPQELCDILAPLLPRFYSIASSSKVVGDEMHLTIALVRYQGGHHERLGVCTHTLCNLAPLDQPVIPIYIQPHKGFTLPENHDTPIIMVGPGTGIAPFRAFAQERLHCNAKGPQWLFFGECHQEKHFFYQDFWCTLEKEGKLRLTTAFSRDQEHKIYVQHEMERHGEELYRWLESGAHLYVCGDAHKMAKDVENALHTIIQKHGNKDETAARDYIKQLRKDKRYLRDVY